MLKILRNAPARLLLAEIGRNAGVTNQILLVPEPLSHETERLLQELGDRIGMSAEVLTFQRIAHRALLREGGLAAPALDAGGRLLLLARAAGDVRARLREWGRVAGGAEFLNELLATIDELKHCECRPEMLGGSAKLEDLRLIWESFEAHAAQTAADPRDLLTQVGALLNERGSIAAGAKLYIDGFISFTAQEYGIITAFIRHGAVTAALPAPRAGDDADMFAQPLLTAERLKRIALKAGAEYSEQTCDTPVKQRRLTRVFSCPDMLAECDWAAGQAAEWIAGGAARDEIAVAVPAWDEYKSVMLSAFARAGIPVFADGVLPVSSKSAARFIEASLDAALNGFEPDAAAALIKTGLAPVTPDEGFMLDDYIKTHNIKGVFWTADRPWTAHPSGWGAKAFTDLDKARLETLNRVRERLRTPFVRLRRALSRSDTGEGFARALYGYLTDMDLAGALAGRREYLSGRGADREADEYRQLWGVIVRVLDNFVGILGGVTLRPEEFARLFALCLSQYEVGVIPVTLDRVRLCALDRLYRRELKYLIIAGANERHMPKRADAPGLLTDEERVLLEQYGVNMAPRAEERASRELYTIHKAFGLPDKELAVSFNTAGKSEMSVFVAELDVNIDVLAPPMDGGGAEWHSDRSPLKAWEALLPPGGALSASRMESYSSCRWAYFSRYGLALRKRGAPGPAPKDAGSMIHAVLEGMALEVMARGGFRTVERGAALEIAGQAADRWLEALPEHDRAGARIKALTARLKQSAVQVAGNVYDELSVSEFQPLAVEHRFTTKDRVPLTGVIDRIDGWIHDDRLYLRVVDYKTGLKKFSLRDVWHGLGMQMLCYLFALNAWDGRPAEPAGVLYLPAHDRFVQAGAGVTDTEVSRKLHSLLKRSGIILSDPAVISAMERGDEKLFIPVRLKRDGGPDARSQVADAARLGLLRRHVEDAMGRLSESIESGSVEANPVCRSASESQCDYCDFAGACYLDGGDSPRMLDGAANIWEKMGERYGPDASAKTGG
ncbi:MAG: PD-(D/E)XK nuclease family protein [Oscillospiraceae bacterium]|nr:PD-(D/E)XK nuclease family protein [Oscillospiraceae bacterium]